MAGVLTGARRGELANLRWSDIDFNNRLVHIKNKEDFTAKSMRLRTGPISQDLFWLPSRIPQLTEHVFIGADHKPYQGAWVTKNFKRAVLRSGLSKKLRFHSLRHTFASWLVQFSTPLAEVQGLLGHSSILMTQIYSHLDEEHLRGAAEKIRINQFMPKGLLG